MAYSADTFTAGETPTTAKWNKLWANDASFNNGTGIATIVATILAGKLTPTPTNTHDIGDGTHALNELYTNNLDSQDGTNIHIRSGNGTIRCDNATGPNIDNTHDFGSLAYAWKEMFAYSYVDRCLWLDHEDDLSILKNARPLKDKDGKLILDKKSGKPQMDNDSLPDWIKVKSKKKGQTPFRNLGHFVDVIAGAVRQLDNKVDRLKNEK